MDYSLLFFVIAGAAAFLVGASKGGLPMVGALGVPLLALVMSPVAAAALLPEDPLAAQFLASSRNETAIARRRGRQDWLL